MLTETRYEIMAWYVDQYLWGMMTAVELAQALRAIDDLSQQLPYHPVFA